MERPRTHFISLGVVYAVALVNLAVTAFVSSRTGVPLESFFRDPTFTLDGHPLTGLQSNLTVLIWCAGAATAFFSAIVLRERGDSTRFQFMFWSGVLTTILMIDDFFLVHDDLVQRYLGLDDKIVLAGHGFALLIYLVVFRKVILETRYVILLLAMIFFGASTVVDVIQERWLSSLRILVEDGFKLLGVISWSAYLGGVGFEAITDRRMPQKL